MIAAPVPQRGRPRCGAIGCTEDPVETIAEVPLCVRHRLSLREAFVLAPTSVVYYVTWDRGETVKIGTTVNPRQRFREHAKIAGAQIEPLAAQSGGRQEERTQHRRFRHLLVPGHLEVFRMGRDLLEHLEVVRSAWPTWIELLDSVSAVNTRRRS